MFLRVGCHHLGDVSSRQIAFPDQFESIESGMTEERDWGNRQVDDQSGRNVDLVQVRWGRFGVR